MIEVEQPEGISGRKLVIETAKYNVVTAYNAKDGLAYLDKVHADIAVVHKNVKDMPVEDLVRVLKQRRPEMPVVVLSPTDGSKVEGADHMISSHDPTALLELFRRLHPID